ncbi:MAG: hypothetical protein JWR80_8550 [Bradyrhizobium sp.]|nr:hypothetical protein [Bradyrhizobium sp.]
MTIWSKLNREWAGHVVIALFLWAPLWLIAGIYVFGSHTAVWICSIIALAPFALGFLALFAMLITCIDSPESGALAVVFGIPALLYLFGSGPGLIIAIAAAIWWGVSRAFFRWLHARSLAR